MFRDFSMIRSKKSVLNHKIPLFQKVAEFYMKGKENQEMKFRPLQDRIMVQRIKETETVKSGIIIPDTAKEKPQEGVVRAVGNGKVLENGTRLPLEVKEGDRILFGKYSGSEIKLEGEEYLIFREDEVLGILS
jgi:chaperonin GroES